MALVRTGKKERKKECRKNKTVEKNMKMKGSERKKKKEKGIQMRK